jgi:hypothetical protein
MILKEVKNEKGKLKIYCDEDAESPREWNNLSKMVCFHREYSLGDNHNYDSKNYSSWEEVAEAIKRDYDIAAMLPLYLYDHSGITISTTPFSCPWDSGQVGWAFITKEDLREEFEIKKITKKFREKAREIILGEVSIYDEYLRGEVYRYVLEDISGETVDSCWSIYGDYVKGISEYIPKGYSDLLKQIA